MSAPVSAAWAIVMATGVPCSGRGRSAQLRGRLVLRPDRDPLAALDLGEGLGARPEVVVGRVERDLAGERRLRPVRVQRVADLLLVERAGRLHAVGEDVPGVPGRGRL